jgi:hypothetical protein
MDNDGRFPNNTWVEVRYARSRTEELSDRAAWPWFPATILSQCGPNEWHICVRTRELGTLEDGSPPPPGAADGDLYYPCCFRDATEIRRTTAEEEQ